jgi:hypothetical protein
MKGGRLKEQEAGPVHQLIGNCGERQREYDCFSLKIEKTFTYPEDYSVVTVETKIVLVLTTKYRMYENVRLRKFSVKSLV